MEKQIIVRERPTILGNSNPRLGMPESYVLDDDILLDSWEFGKYVFGRFVDASAYILRFGNTNAFGLVVMKPDNYVIRAGIAFDSGIQYVDFPITVGIEGTPDNIFMGTGIYPVDSYRHKTNGSMKVVVKNRTLYPIDYNYVALDNSYSFQAFDQRPSSDHPLYSSMVQIYRHNDYYGGYAYTSMGMILQPPNGTFPGLPGGEKEPAFIAFRNLQPGTIPIYEIDVVSRSSYGEIVSAYRYPSKNNVTGKIETSGSITTTTSNMGVMGYVYPSI